MAIGRKRSHSHNHSKRSTLMRGDELPQISELRQIAIATKRADRLVELSKICVAPCKGAK